MVVQKTINNLKERPKDEKTVVAGGVAVFVVGILLVGYGLWFVSNIKRGGQFNTYVAPKAQDKFLAPDIRDAGRALQDTMRPNEDLLREFRDTTVDAPPPVDSAGEAGDPFNTGNF
jgi:hypothetical protein